MVMAEKLSKQPWSNTTPRDKKSLLQYFREALVGKKVPDKIISKYNQKINQMQLISPILQAFDPEKMCDEEFLLFLKIQQQLVKNSGEYQGLNTCIILLINALEKRYYLNKIEQIEAVNTGIVEQELYNFVEKILENLPDKLEFQASLVKKLESLLTVSEGDSVSSALNSYAESLEKIAQDNRQIELLYLFKKYKNSQCISSDLDTIAQVLNQYERAKLSNLDKLTQSIQSKNTVFQQIGNIFGIPKDKNNPSTYAKIIQYIILRYKYQKHYLQFKRLTELLLQWQKYYLIVISIQKEYHPHEYKQPKEFCQKLPGLEIYEKYKDYLPEEIGT
jgi:hypothetical protein